MQVAATSPKPVSGPIIVTEYRGIQQAAIEGKDHFTLTVDGVQKDYTLEAAKGKHPSQFNKQDKFHYSELKVHEETKGDPKSAATTTYDLSSADGVDNMILMHKVPEQGKAQDISLSYPTGFIMSDGSNNG
ncbi:MAG TPA: hypothetical protein VGO93_22065 [Candidatus Xenobia bacterium]|jgi:hypothetical protein